MATSELEVLQTRTESTKAELDLKQAEIRFNNIKEMIERKNQEIEEFTAEFEKWREQNSSSHP